MLSIVAELDAEAVRHGDRLHTAQGSLTLTYAQFVAATHRVACALRQAGIGEGDRIAIWSRNDARMLQAIYGTLRCKAVIVPLNARNSVPENVSLLQRFGCKALMVQKGLTDLRALSQDVPGLALIVPFDPCDGLSGFDEWSSGSADVFPDLFVRADDPAAIFITSGTTGQPKGILHSHFGLAMMAAGYRDVVTAARGARHLVVAPLTHVAGGIVYATMGVGSTQYIADSAQPASILDTIAGHRIDLLFAPPTLVYALIDEQQRQPRDLSSLKVLMYAGSSISPERLRQAIEVFGDVLLNIYSQSEVIYPISSMSTADHRRIAAGEERLLKSAGRATRQGAVSIMDDGGRHLAPNQAGEIVTRSLGGMKEFLDDPDATATLREHGWHHTGDVGYLDDEGFLFIVDRKKDMIISGGFNVYSAEVESVLLQHQAVADAAVVGVPDPKWGEAVRAFVVPRAGTALDLEELGQFCKTLLGSVKSPKDYIVRNDLPRNSAGKVLKRMLREGGEVP
ncbi:MAG: O-succinylbenzoic acid--CoA ligase [Tardiphaga sp.]|jgi:acyl-CoA synthetase (AMP-forming)/AMP-acid ligase II|nr:O-succinylbenzoic acid--CoA ligase [Tardiphaga sp.]